MNRLRAVKKLVAATLAVLTALWIAGCFGIYSEMRRPPEQFGRFMMRLPGPVPFLLFPFESMWLRARSGTLRVGDAAPDFTLTTVDKSGSVKLSELARQRPVVLVFGSYT
jgi:hypothetical protein